MAHMLNLLLVSNGDMVQDDAVDYLRASPDFDTSAETALRDVALVSDLDVPVDAAVEADLLDYSRQTLVVRLLLPPIIVDVLLVLPEEV